MHHELKTVNHYFQRVWFKEKTFEVRQNDRDFQTGDTITLREYDKETDKYSGREVMAIVGYVLRDFKAVEPGFVIFSLLNLVNHATNPNKNETTN